MTLSASDGKITGSPTAGAESKSFQIKVTDNNGATDSARFTLNITSAVPNVPTSLAGVEGRNSVALTWTPPTPISGVTITNYIINYLKPKGEHNDDGEGDDEEKGSISISATTYPNSYTLTELKNGLNYTITISAKSSGGTSSASAGITVNPGSKPTAPKSVSAVRSSSGISVRWKKPDDNGGRNVTSWKVECKDNSDSLNSYSTSVLTPDKGDDDQYRYLIPQSETKLISGHKYQCRVAAVSPKGDGDWSDYSAEVTFAKVPNAPQDVTYDLKDISSGKVLIAWSVPSSNGGSSITSYSAYIKKSDASEDDNESKRLCSTSGATPATTCTILGAPTKGTFKARVFATNAIGDSNYSEISFVIPGKTQVLTKPTISDKRVGDSDFEVGATVSSGLKLKYTIASGYEDKCAITDRGLVKVKAAGTCRVTISQDGRKQDSDGKDAGDSEYEKISDDYVEFTIVDRAPSTPIISSVGIGNTQLTLNWTAPNSSGGKQTGYDIERANAATGTCASDSTSCTWGNATTALANDVSKVIGSLTNGTAYRLRIRATNSGGQSNWVVAPSSYTPYTVPAAPVLSDPVGYSDTSTVTIAWSEPANNGAAISSYTFTATGGGVSRNCTTGSSTLTCTFTGLTNNINYTFVGKASNAAGASANSNTVSIKLNLISQTITVTNRPSVYGYTAGDPNVQLTASASSGLPIQWSSTNSSICTVNSTGSVRLITSGNCEIQINQDGKDASGNSTKYAAATAATPIQLSIDPATPSAPSITSVTNSNSGLVIAWTAPSRLGGGSISYTISAALTDGGSAIDGANCSTSSLTCTIGSPLVKGTTYWFTAVATATAGTGPASSAKSGVWYTVPDVPSTPTVSAVNDATAADPIAINVSFPKSANSNGSNITSYEILGTAEDNSTVSCTVNVTSQDASPITCLLRATKPGLNYKVKARALNAAGASAWSSETSEVKPGIAQTITLNSTKSVSILDPDFNVGATNSSGNVMTYSSSNTSLCTVSNSGLVHVVAVTTGTPCTITVSSAATGIYLAASNATMAITITKVKPNKPTITSISSDSSTVTVTWVLPTFTGGASILHEKAWLVSDNTKVCTPVSGHSCTITGISSGNYSVEVVIDNDSASDSNYVTKSDSASAVVYSNPKAPLPVSATGGIRQITVTWTAPTDTGGHEITGYEIASKLSSEDDTKWVSLSDLETSTARSKVVTKSLNGTSYDFKVRARVDGAEALQGDWSNKVSAKTLDLPSAPGTPSLTSVNSSGPALTVTWNAPASDGGSSITSYSATATNGSITFTCISNSGSPITTSCTITGLLAATSYSVAVTAQNGVGTGPSSTASTGATANVPDGVQTLSATGDNSNASATVTWTAPANGGKAITSYVVKTYIGGTLQSQTCSTTGGLTCKVNGLSYKTAYTFKVFAYNELGASNSTVDSNSVTLNKSQTITFNTIDPQLFTSGYIALSAFSDSGLPITYSTSTSAYCTISGSTVSFVKVGVCTVTAGQNGDGSSFDAAVSQTQSFNITAVNPDPITLSQVIPGAAKLTTQWTQATQLGGAQFANYVLSWATKADFSDENSTTINSVSSLSSDISSLLERTTYRVRVKVVTDSGNSSAWSNVLTGTTFGLPAKPAKPTTAAVSTPGLVTVNWVNLDSGDSVTGGTPIIGYTAEAYAAGSATGIKCTSMSSTCDISGLNGSTTYTFKVTVFNVVGGTTSDASDSVQPGISQVISTSNRTVKHGQDPVLDASTVTSGLSLYYSVATTLEDASGVWSAGRNVCSMSAGVISFDLAGSCQITISQDGTDTGNHGSPTAYLPATSKLEVITVQAVVPGPVTGLTLTPADGHVDASWSVVADDGGTPITGYQLSWYVSKTGTPGETALNASEAAGNTAPSSYGRLNLGPSTLNADLLGLTNGVTYTFEIQAINKVGVGPIK